MAAEEQALIKPTHGRRVLQDTTNTSQVQTLNLTVNLTKAQEQTWTQRSSQLVLEPEGAGATLRLSHDQRRVLQQQIQQHVQLLTQVHLLTRGTQGLSHEAHITKLFLVELGQFSCRPGAPARSSFEVCNLPLALELLEDDGAEPRATSGSGASADSRRWLPSMTPATNGHAFPLLPTRLAWLFATHPAFTCPELLPVCSFHPTHHTAPKRQIYTRGEDGLLVLALKHFQGTVNPEQLITDFVLCKKRSSLTKHIRELSSSRAPPNVVKSFFTSGAVPPLPVACCRVHPSDLCPAVDRSCSQCPNWLKNSRGIIQKTRISSSPPRYPQSPPIGCTLRLHPHWLAKGRPLKTPKRRLFTLAHNETLLPLAKKHGPLQQETESGALPDGDASSAEGKLEEAPDSAIPLTRLDVMIP